MRGIRLLSEASVISSSVGRRGHRERRNEKKVMNPSKHSSFHPW